ncbi:lymphocyte antigen 6E-like [Rhinophrynus dorsalis]
MAALKVLLVLTAICIGTAVSLQCYTCTVQSSNSNCMTATNCTANETSCMTIFVSASVWSVSTTTITKACASNCTASSFGMSVVSTSVACCSTDLCNTSGAYGIKSSYAALALALGFLSVLLRN